MKYIPCPTGVKPVPYTLPNTLLNVNIANRTRGYDIALAGVPVESYDSCRFGASLGAMHLRRHGTYTLTADAEIDIHTIKSASICDCGDLEIPHAGWKEISEAVIEQTLSIIDDDAIPIYVGGDRVITNPALTACHLRSRNPIIIRLDARPDSSLLDHDAIQLGVHDGWVNGEQYRAFRDRGYLAHSVDNIRARLCGRPVWFSFSMNYLDPAYAPGCSEPTPGGASTSEAIAAIERILLGVTVAGADLVDLTALRDPSETTINAASHILGKICTMTALSLVYGKRHCPSSCQLVSNNARLEDSR